jgi:hypothetical protein
MDINSRMHFPGYSKEAVIFLVEKAYQGYWDRYLSGDCGNCSDFKVHHIINGAGKFILKCG